MYLNGALRVPQLYELVLIQNRGTGYPQSLEVWDLYHVWVSGLII